MTKELTFHIPSAIHFQFNKFDKDTGPNLYSQCSKDELAVCDKYGRPGKDSHSYFFCKSFWRECDGKGKGTEKARHRYEYCHITCEENGRIVISMSKAAKGMKEVDEYIEWIFKEFSKDGYISL